MSSETTFIGRGEDVAQLWQTLRERSVLLTGARRVGKTELLRQLVREPDKGWTGLRIDLESCRSANTGVQMILDRLGDEGLGRNALARSVDKVEEASAAGLGVKLRQLSEAGPWAALREGVELAVQHLRTARPAQPTTVLLLCLDELPWWLDEIRRTDGPDEARQALAVLRQLRQRDDLRAHLRMVLTGSIGLAGLAHLIGASAEINDITPSTILKPLDPAAGASLFETELTARGVSTTSRAARQASAIAGHFPHWVKVLAERAAGHVEAGRQVDLDEVGRVVADLLHPRMRDLFRDEGAEHFVRRYGQDEARLMTAILDAAAGEDGAPEAALLAAGLGVDPSRSRRAVLEMIYRLVDAFYLDQKAGSDRYVFLLPLLRLWWTRYGGGV